MRKIILFFSLILFLSSLQAQELPELKSQKAGALSIYFGGASSRILNANWSSDNNLEIHNPICFNGGFTYTKYFNEHLGITLGCEFANYKTNFRCAQYNKGSVMQSDNLGQNYLTITQADYSVNRTIGNVELPICFRYESGGLNKTGFFADLGIKFCSAVSSVKKSTGTLTTMALYPDPRYSNAGFLVWDQYATNDQTIQMSSSDEYVAKSLSVSLYGQAGLIVPLSSRLRFTNSIYYMSSLGDVNVSEKGSDYVNYLGAHSAYKASSTVSVGFRFGLVLSVGGN
jgi:hypothetical protein